MNLITIRDIENYKKELEKLIKDNNFTEAKENTHSFFYDIKKNMSYEEFKELLNISNIQDYQKDIFLDLYKNGADVSEYLAFKMVAIASIEKEKQLIFFEKLIFSEELYNIVNKKYQKIEIAIDDGINDEYLNAMLFLRDKVLPNIKAEICAKFYIYIASGNFYNDFHTDEIFREKFQNNEQNSYSILEKIHKHLELWEVVRNKTNDYDCYINKRLNSYSSYGYDASSPSKNFYSNTPSGCFDAVMKSPFENKYFIARASNNHVESDIYDHLNKRIAEETALMVKLENFNATAMLFDFQKGHNENIINKFSKDKLNESEFIEIKKIFDIMLQKAVSEITGINPIIIQIGDRKYNIEQDDFLDLSLKFTNFIINKNVDLNHKFVINTIEKTAKWLISNLMRNLDFYEDEAFKKCELVVKNLCKIKRNHDIQTTNFTDSLDHLIIKIQAKEFSKQKAILECKKSELTLRKNNLNKSNLLNYIDHNSFNNIINLRNQIIDEVINFIYYGTYAGNPLTGMEKIVRANNMQYQIFEKIFDKQIVDEIKVTNTMLSKININDPLLKLLYEIKENIVNFDNSYDIKYLNNLENSFINLSDFYSKKGDIYKFFESKNKKLIDKHLDALSKEYDAEKYTCNLVNDISKFKLNMASKLQSIHFMLEKNKDAVESELIEINNLQEEIEENGLININKLDNIKKNRIFKRQIN